MEVSKVEKPKRIARAGLICSYIAMGLLLVAIIFLPFLVTWYVETKGRSQSLATTVMLTCYPLSPFAAVALYSLSRVMKNIISGNFFCRKNIIWMRRISYCCFIAAAGMIFAGFFYMPFFIAGAAAGFCGLLSLCMAGIFISITPEEELKFMKEEK